MSNNAVQLRFLYRKVINNDCTKTELIEFFEIIKQLPDSDLLMLAMEQNWNEHLEQQTDVYDTRVSKRLNRILAAGRMEHLNVLPLRKPRYLPWLMAGAAAVLLLVTGLALFYNQRKDTSVAAVPSVSRVSDHHQQVKLPDGTIVTVNLNSRLLFNKTFSADKREVFLSGEAFFEIASDVKRPFIVHTGPYVTTVLGTRFNVRAYPGTDNYAVTVSTGKVQVADSTGVLAVLKGDEQLVIHPETGRAERANVDAHETSQWKVEDLIFENATWEDAAVLIEKKFGIQVLFHSLALKNCRFTGTFYSGNGLTQLLDIATGITNSRWKKTGTDSITIYGDGCSAE